LQQKAAHPSADVADGKYRSDWLTAFMTWWKWNLLGAVVAIRFAQGLRIWDIHLLAIRCTAAQPMFILTQHYTLGAWRLMGSWLNRPQTLDLQAKETSQTISVARQ
jgi:hypothetical protein